MAYYKVVVEDEGCSRGRFVYYVLASDQTDAALNGLRQFYKQFPDKNNNGKLFAIKKLALTERCEAIQ